MTELNDTLNAHTENSDSVEVSVSLGEIRRLTAALARAEEAESLYRHTFGVIQQSDLNS